ncbi:hypothetical protein WSM22_37590 [Cytophagales bacterium WSM2-2]|nr:hypothetical protein WSM22_37590 [Cytophagales bacterium WSM2-2]
MPKKIVDVGYNSYYIAGATPDRIYLGNSMAPALLIAANYSLSDTQHLQLKFPSQVKLYQGATVTVGPSNVYLMEGKTPALLRGKLSDLTMNLVRDSLEYFIGSMPLSPESYVIKIYDPILRKSVLAKKKIKTGWAHRVPEILEKQVDGIFCTDGMISYDPYSGSLIYVYYYRNQFIRLDTSLNILYRGRTIDTTSHARIKVSEIESKNMITLSGPPMTVNKRSCVSGEYIFIHSGLLSNNEEKKTFDHCSVIDVYNLKNGEYRFSFYLPDYNKKKISGFRVFNKTLVAMYDHFLYSYQLNF